MRRREGGLLFTGDLFNVAPWSRNSMEQYFTPDKYNKNTDVPP
jgi:endonuclease/exonuclease/phosphatase (EEP) superfamily protein YafD